MRGADALGGILVAATVRKLAINLMFARREGGGVRAGLSGVLPWLEYFCEERGNDDMLAACFLIGGEKGSQAKVVCAARRRERVGYGLERSAGIFARAPSDMRVAGENPT